VHGLSGSSRWWTAVLPTLADRYETHLLDVPRFGAAFRPERVSEWIAAWADAAGLPRLRLAGHSLGGGAAARLAAEQPDRVEALALIAPAGIASGRRLAGYALPLAESLLAAGP
jgi:pimeloyl-ACP methyl ester carboxylesterase